MTEDSLISLHFGLGLWVRNELRKNPDLLASILIDLARREGHEDSWAIHTDSVSAAVITEAWRLLQSRHP